MRTMRLLRVWLVIGLMVLSGGSLAYGQWFDCGVNTCTNDNVGIGTTSPPRTLSLSVPASSDTQGLTISTTGNTVGHQVGIRTGFNGADSLSGAALAAVLEVAATGGNDPGVGWKFFTNHPTRGGIESMRIDSPGKVGIGTTSPNHGGFSSNARVVSIDSQGVDNDAAVIELTGKDASGSSDVARLNFLNNDAGTFRELVSLRAFRSGANNSGAFKIMISNAGEPSEGLRITNDGNVGIGTTSPTSKLHVAGDATIDGNIAAKYQDVAEWVRTPVQLAPGTVVVIDPVESNRVLPSSQSYDTRIAGVVSSQPGIILGEAGEDKAKVAHSGRVKVKVDAQFGPISVGDLLVSSATTGYAMRSTPIEMNGISLHRPGTIVGKALEPLKEGEGEILVLLTLQ